MHVLVLRSNTVELAV